MQLKKIISGILAVAIAASMCVMPLGGGVTPPRSELAASAYSSNNPRTDTSGKCGDNVTWTLDSNGLLTISGNGAMTDYAVDGSPFYNREDITSVVMKYGVTSIGNYAFISCSNLESIVIPDTVTKIGNYAFCHGYELKNITIPDSVTTIGGSAFWNCNKLEGITIPDSVTSIGYEAFCNCKKFKNITVPESVTNIAEDAFKYCASLESITILNPKCVIYDKESTICSTYESQGEKDGVYYGVFYFFGKIRGYKNSTAQAYAEKYKYNFEAIDGEASSDTSGKCGDNVTWVLDSKGVLTISGTGDMYNYNSIDNKSPFNGSKSVVIKDGVKSIGGYTFYEFYSLTSITIPDSVTSIGQEAFGSCESLTSITLPNSVTSIGSGAFINCESLASITIPDSVTSIGEKAFANCRKLKSITILNPECYIPDNGDTIYTGYNGKYYFNGIIYGYKNSTAQAYAEKYKYNFEAIDGETSSDTSGKCGDNVTWVLDSKGVLTISGTGKMYNYNSDSPFNDREDIKSVVIEKGVTSIGNGIFGCSSIESVSIPDTVTSIGDSAFMWCGWLKSVNIPDSVIEISGFAFENCALREITIPDSVKNIGEYAFSGCSLLTEVTLPDSVKEIGECAFSICSSLKSITILNSQCDIYDDSYTISNRLENYKVYFDGTIYGYKNSTAQAYAEKYKYNFEAIDGEASSDTSGKCGDNVTWNLDSKGVLTISGTGDMYNYNSLDNKSPFNGSKDIKSVVIKNGVTSIGYYAFDACTSLTSVTIPDSVTSIGYYAFDKCTSLKNVTIPASVTGINGGAFSYCCSLTEITILNSGCEICDEKTTIYNEYNKAYIFNGTIFGYKNSTAQAYAKKYGYKFEAIDGETPTTTPTTTTTTKLTTTTTKAATTTAKPSSSTTKATTTQPIVTNGSFQWGRDNWNFNNTSDFFSSGTYFLGDDYREKLRQSVDNKEWETIRQFLGYRWGGSCYGMSAVALLAKHGMLTCGLYTPGADCLNKLASPNQNKGVESLVNYYFLLQLRSEIQQYYRLFPMNSNEQNIKAIISALDSSPMVLVGYQQKYFGGHAVIAYSHEGGAWNFGGVTYNGRINILDPNCSMGYDEKACIYYKTGSYNWTVPKYSQVNSMNGAVFNLVLEDKDIVNRGGFLGGVQMNYKNDYIASLEVNASAENYGVSKVMRSNGVFVNLASGTDEIVPTTFYIASGASDGREGYILKDAKAAYKASQDKFSPMDMKIDYENCLMKASAPAASEVVFDPAGFAGIVGDGTDFSIEMVYNEGHHPTDWYKLIVSGSNIEEIGVEKTDEGFILSGNNISDVTVTALNDSHEARKSFSADCKSVLIYEIDEDTVGIKADNDGDGKFETDIDGPEGNDGSGKTKVPEGIEPTSYGDTNLDGAINIADVVQLNKFLLNKKDNPIEGPSLANADCMRDGYIDSSDSTLLMNYVSMQITEDKLGNK